MYQVNNGNGSDTVIISLAAIVGVLVMAVFGALVWRRKVVKTKKVRDQMNQQTTKESQYMNSEGTRMQHTVVVDGNWEIPRSNITISHIIGRHYSYCY